MCVLGLWEEPSLGVCDVCVSEIASEGADDFIGLVFESHVVVVGESLYVRKTELVYECVNIGIEI